MSKSRLELKVGLFVLIGLALLGILLLQFGKGASLFRPTYTIQLKTESAGGLRKHAGVLMSGVQVGTVTGIRLAEDGKSVVINLKIYEEFIVRDDAQFLIKQSGFLGDNYVEINPAENAGEPYKDGATATALKPFDLQEVARSAAGFIERVDEAASKLNAAIADVRRLLLNEQTLTNLASAAVTLRATSERALSTIGEIDMMFATNGPAVSQSASNLVLASEGLSRFAATLNGVLDTNSGSFAASVKNIESSTEALKNLLEDVQAGKGLAGTLLQDEQVGLNVADILQNLSMTSSNMNRLGLWRGVLFPRKPRGEEPAGRKLSAPGSPFD